MTQEEFIRMYSIQFMASYKASKYEDSCVRSEHESLEDHGAFCDAIHLAQSAWISYCTEMENVGYTP